MPHNIHRADNSERDVKKRWPIVSAETGYTPLWNTSLLRLVPFMGDACAGVDDQSKGTCTEHQGGKSPDVAV